jgi:hypothetical protein
MILGGGVEHKDANDAIVSTFYSMFFLMHRYLLRFGRHQALMHTTAGFGGLTPRRK